MSLQDQIDRITAKKRAKGERDDFALFYDDAEWEAHLGGHPHVKLGEVDGDLIGRGPTIESALDDLERQL